MKSFRQYIFESRLTESKGEMYGKVLELMNSPEYRSYSHGFGNSFWETIGHGVGTVEIAKRRIFGNELAQKKPELFWYHKTKGVITHPAGNLLTHYNVESNLFNNSSNPINRLLDRESEDERIDQKVVSEIGSMNNIVGRGRIEHRDDGTGFITYSHIGGTSPSSVVRTLERRHPSYLVLDHMGRML